MPQVHPYAGRVDLPTRDMQKESGCFFCHHSDPSRTCQDKIRCTRFSEWVDPHKSCEAMISRADKQFLAQIGVDKDLKVWFQAP